MIVAISYGISEIRNIQVIPFVEGNGRAAGVT